MRRTASRSFVLVLLVAVTTAALAQVRQVSVIGYVTDQKGVAVTQVPAGELSFVIGNHAAPNVTFVNASNLPLVIGVLVDTSNSARGQRYSKTLVNAAGNLLINVVHPGKDAGLIADFDTEIGESSGLTDDPKRWVQAVKQFRIGGATALFDVISKTCTKQLRPDLGIGTVRRVLIVITDGSDNQSSIRASEAARYAQQQNVIMYFLNPEARSRVEKSWGNVSTIAEASGGRAYYFSSEKDIAAALGQILAEIAAQQLVLLDIPASSPGPISVRGDGKGLLQWHGPLSLPVTNVIPSQ